MKNSVDVQQTEVEEVQEAMGRMSEAEAVEILTELLSNRPSMRVKMKQRIHLIEEGLRDEAAAQREREILDLLAKARDEQRRAQPDLESDQRWITLSDYLDADEKQKVMEGLDAIALAEPAVDVVEQTPEPKGRLQFDKASGDLRRVVAWLLKADYRTKMGVILSHNLLQHEGTFKGNTYEGDIGNDHINDWETEIANRQIEAGGNLTEEDFWIEGFTCALMDIDA